MYLKIARNVKMLRHILKIPFILLIACLFILMFPVFILGVIFSYLMAIAGAIVGYSFSKNDFTHEFASSCNFWDIPYPEKWLE